jgi:putative aminopeptidase FrvX
MTSALELVRQLIAIPAPSGEEDALRVWVRDYLARLGYSAVIDPKGNVTLTLEGEGSAPSVLVTAHLDEIGLMVTRVEPDGRVRVTELGGAYTWKWGETPVDILTTSGAVSAILSYGSIHTNNEESVVEFARKNPLPFKKGWLFTGRSAEELAALGVRPGLRVVLSRSRRVVTELGDFIGSYFLDDRVDIAVMLMALETMKAEGFTYPGKIVFAATASEEIGGSGARYILNRFPADICIALEIGPKTPDADFPLDSNPTIWVRDGYAPMEAVDGRILEECCADLGISPHWQYLSRGGSDATCSADIGLTARPVTLAVGVDNSHGYEIMHRYAPENLLKLFLAYLRYIAG